MKGMIQAMTGTAGAGPKAIQQGSRVNFGRNTFLAALTGTGARSTDMLPGNKKLLLCSAPLDTDGHQL
jgi:hypothetical protein